MNRKRGRIENMLLLAFAGSAFLAVVDWSPASVPQAAAADTQPLTTCPQTQTALNCNPKPTPDPTEKPTPKPTPTPVATLSPDETALVTIANKYTRTCSGSALGCTIHMGIVGKYALVGFTDEKNSGEAFIATKPASTWQVVVKGGGWFIQSDLLKHEPAMGATTASQLESAATPIWSKCKCS